MPDSESTSTYFVPVTFTIAAASPEEAAEIVSEYLEEAASCVIDPRQFLAVYVEDDDVEEYVGFDDNDE